MNDLVIFIYLLRIRFRLEEFQLKLLTRFLSRLRFKSTSSHFPLLSFIEIKRIGYYC